MFDSFKSTYKNFILQFKSGSIFVASLKRFMLLLFIPLIILNFLTTLYQQKATALELKVASDHIFSTVSNTVEKIYDEAENIFLLLSLEKGLELFVGTDDITTLSGANLGAVLDTLSIAKTHTTLSNNIESIYIYSYKADYVLSTLYNGKASEFSDKPWINYQSENMSFSLRDGNSFCICYNVVSNMEKVGLIVFNVKSNRIKETLETSTDNTYGLSLYNEDKQLIYALDNNIVSEPDFSAKHGENTIIQTNNQSKTTVSIDDIYLHIYTKHTHPIYTSFILITCIYAIAVLLISFILAFIFSSYSYSMIKDIILEINDTGINALSDSSVNEIMYINQNIIKMKNKNKELEQEFVKNFAELKKMHTQVLQMQLTPHFLFNALNTLNLSIMLKNGVDNPESASILLLSDLLSSSIDVKHYMVTVKQEISYCEKYVKIQSLMSEHDFDFNCNVEDNVLNCIAVKFSLQPIIENAFKHGIKLLGDDSRGLLNISIKKVDNYIQYRIENNGPLPDVNTLNRINNILDNSLETDSNHVGLFNTNRRIKLIFGDDYGCNINVENGLTVTTIKTPIVTDLI